MSDKYILEGHVAVKCEDTAKWGKWLESADRVVARTEGAGAEISTVFLGLDHSFDGGLPLIFETMVFGGKHDQNQDRYSTWEEAETGHAKMCAKVFQATTNKEG